MIKDSPRSSFRVNSRKRKLMSTPFEIMVSNQMKAHRVLFWYDPGGEHRSDFDAIWPQDYEKRVIENNEFALKYEILCEKPQTKFLLYSPSAEPEPIENWLLDVLLANGEFYADEKGAWLNELQLDSRWVSFLEHYPLFFKKAGNREGLQRRLKESMPKDNDEMFRNCCAVLFDSLGESWDDLILKLMSDCIRADDKLENALILTQMADNFCDQLSKIYSYKTQSPDAADLALSFFNDEYIRQKGGKPVLSNEAHLLMNRWKNNTRSAAYFRRISGWAARQLQIEDELAELDAETLINIDVFMDAQEMALEKLAADLECGTLPEEKLQRTLSEGAAGPWAEQLSDAWEAVAAAARFFSALNSFRLQINTWEDGFRKYVTDWFRIDRHYRRFETAVRRSKADNISEALRQALEALRDAICKAYENRYLHPLCRKWHQIITQDDGRKCSAFKPQCDFYNNTFGVSPLKRKTVVIISDGMRFDIGQELAEKMNGTERYSASLQAMQGVLPSYTPLGMAALLPHRNLELKADGKTVKVDGKSSSGIDARRAILQSYNSEADAIKATEMMELSTEKLAARLKGVRLLYIYHNEVDEEGDDKETELGTFKAAEDLLDDKSGLPALIRKCAGLRFAQIYVTADHGFLFQFTPPDDSMFPVNDPPKERTTYYHPRFVLGTDLDDQPALRKIEPRGYSTETGVFETNGEIRLRLKGAGKRYVHGGTSLHETAIPLLNIEYKTEHINQKVRITLANNTEKRIITTSVKIIEFFQQDAVREYDPMEPDKAEIQPLTVTAGFYDPETGEAVSDEHEICFNLTEPEDRLRLVQQRFTFGNNAVGIGKKVELRLTEQLSASQTNTQVLGVYTLRRVVENDFD